ncbi:hypothetical protein BB409_03435 [Helicobacter pylori]|uniref:Uncharacterized protein n=1 Tax=Helicobacter pylori TaxID=210 RepID=A0AAX0RHD6_HELPX|nr:hypothetical protein BB409_03435 [Helicobacter pylori]PDW46747.1 hypothetical protein BB432_04230 [Helicobacter pylori]
MNGFIQYSFLKNLFLSFLIVNFYFVVELFLKADRGILKQHPLFLTPLNPLKKRFKKLSLVSGASSFIFVLKCL